MANEPINFDDAFEKLTGNQPMSWQCRLYDEWIANNVGSVIDLPTGMGKTAVMAIWVLAREKNPALGRRLIYVVDRRTVVDQATDLAQGIQKTFKKFGSDKLAISTLRGQLADNREWSTDPSRPAIIIGTVDLIGSALLFSGYRSSYKRRPLEAGLLGQDSLLVLDEAHLSKPFEKLICDICDQGRFQKDQDSKTCVRPMRVTRMSATSANSTDSTPFTLQFGASGNLAGEDAKDAIITERFCAKKSLQIIPLKEKENLNKKLTDAAIELAQKPDLIGKRIVVFVRKPDDARAIADAICVHMVESIDNSVPKPKKIKAKPYETSVDVLTGTMRGLERDELVEKSVFKDRWLNGKLDPSDPTNQQPVFLISTSAGEVGFDLNADHLIGDAAPLDSWIQRLGRVNRRGSGVATVILIKENKPNDKTDFDKACIAASKLLTDGMDVSPKALAAFKKSLSSEQIDEATSPPPTMVDLTDILLDAWSMTSITEPMPGRPEVAPWLRGIADELPQTTIAWRAELDLPGFDQLDLETIEEWFDTHRLLTHETLSVPTSAAAKWFTERYDELEEHQRSKIGSRSIIVDRAGLKLITIKEVIDQIARKNTDAIRNADLILPASFGGIERETGLLDPAAPKKPEDKSDADEERRNANAKLRSEAPDVADARGRYREVITKVEDDEPDIKSLAPGTKPPKFSRFIVELESDDDRMKRLVSYVPKQEKPEWGSKRQLLSEHVALVRERVDDILSRIDVPDTVKQAAQLAADFHDHGKNRQRWQRTVDGTATDDTTAWLRQTKLEGNGTHQTLGKSGGEMKHDPRGYRHEFGSLREFIDAHQGKVNQDVFDLAMYLIATHHGRGRPHFPKGGFDPDCESRSDEIHTESIRRFARLQRKYGWWHLAWLENLLRCADAMASAEDDGENK